MKKVTFLIFLSIAAVLAVHLYAAPSSDQAIGSAKAETNARGQGLLRTLPAAPATAAHASITITATGAAANGVIVVAAQAGKTIVVTGWSISTDTAGRITLHHQTGAAVRSNSASNIIGGGVFGANSGERATSGAYPGLAVNQPVCVDFSAAMTAVEVVVEYYTY